MEAQALCHRTLTCAALPSSASPLVLKSSTLTVSSSHSVSCRGKLNEKDIFQDLPKEFHDDEWQARQREKTKEFNKRVKEEEEEEERKVDEYREIGLRLRNYPEEDLVKARKLVSSFIRSAEEVEEKIEEAAEKGELNELVLLVIYNRLDLARRDAFTLFLRQNGDLDVWNLYQEERDAIRSLDLLYRRVEAEILRREATPAMQLLNNLLNLHDGYDDEGWLKACKKTMVETFPREDPFSLLVPHGFDIDKHEGPMRRIIKDDDIIFRVDFVREVDQLLQEVKKSEQENVSNTRASDPESIANKLKQQEKLRAIHQVETLLDLAINLTW